MNKFEIIAKLKEQAKNKQEQYDYWMQQVLFEFGDLPTGLYSIIIENHAFVFNREGMELIILHGDMNEPSKKSVYLTVDEMKYLMNHKEKAWQYIGQKYIKGIQ